MQNMQKNTQYQELNNAQELSDISLTKSYPRILVIMATYNEADNIALIIQDVFNSFNAFNKSCSYNMLDILIIDDNSPDKTYQIVNNLIDNQVYKNRLHLIKRACKLGLGTAYVVGFRWAIDHDYHLVIHMDADFSHNSRYLQSLIDACLYANYDLALGSRYIHGGGIDNWGLIRKCVSYFGNLYAKWMLNISINDLTGGFKCFKIEALKALNLDQLISGGYSFQIETTYKIHQLGFKIKEIPIIFEDRRLGASKMSLSIALSALWNVFLFRFGKK